ncbi:MAG: HlyD family efflux transporter periplasmic adaptor subunit [Christensenellales bacterium]
MSDYPRNEWGAPPPNQDPYGAQPWGQPAQPDGRSAQPPIQPPSAPLPTYGEDEDDGYFTPARPLQQPAPPPGASIPAPPPYQGDLRTPPPGYGPGYAPAGYTAPEGEEPPERIPYQAPIKPRRTSMYVGLGLLLLLVVFGGMALSQMLSTKNEKTAIVAISRQGSTYAGKAIIVRNESAYSQESVSTVRYAAEEGQPVSRGDPVCTVYTSGLSNRELTSLQKYRKEIKSYLKILNAKNDTPDTRLQRADTLVLQRAGETQALVRGAAGNMINQEALLREAMAARYSYLRQKYPDDTKLSRLYDNENNQLQRIETWAKQFAASDNGLVSFYTDGFEAALNMNNYANYTPQQVSDMLAGRVPEAYQRLPNHTDIFRLVRQYNYAVLLLSDNEDWNPNPGEEYQMIIESFASTTVSAIVESVTKAEGKLLVRLHVPSAVDPVLYMRNCQVQLSTTTITYAVPQAALRSQGGTMGVVVRFREGDYLVPVNVISTEGNLAHVLPVNSGFLYEGLTVLVF